MYNNSNIRYNTTRQHQLKTQITFKRSNLKHQTLKHKPSTDTIPNITPQPSTPIERAGSDILEDERILEYWEENINKYM